MCVTATSGASLRFSKCSVSNVFVYPTSRSRKLVTQNARESAASIFCLWFSSSYFLSYCVVCRGSKDELLLMPLFLFRGFRELLWCQSQMKYNSLCARVKSICLPCYNCCKDCTTAAISQLNINDACVSSMSNDTYVQPLYKSQKPLQMYFHQQKYVPC